MLQDKQLKMLFWIWGVVAVFFQKHVAKTYMCINILFIVVGICVWLRGLRIHGSHGSHPGQWSGTNDGSKF